MLSQIFFQNWDFPANFRKEKQRASKGVLMCKKQTVPAVHEGV
jgi:hypothetical protein